MFFPTAIFFPGKVYAELIHSFFQGVQKSIFTPGSIFYVNKKKRLFRLNKKICYHSLSKDNFILFNCVNLGQMVLNIALGGMNEAFLIGVLRPFYSLIFYYDLTL